VGVICPRFWELAKIIQNRKVRTFFGNVLIWDPTSRTDVDYQPELRLEDNREAELHPKLIEKVTIPGVSSGFLTSLNSDVVASHSGPQISFISWSTRRLMQTLPEQFKAAAFLNGGQHLVGVCGVRAVLLRAPDWQEIGSAQAEMQVSVGYGFAACSSLRRAATGSRKSFADLIHFRGSGLARVSFPAIPDDTASGGVHSLCFVDDDGSRLAAGGGHPGGNIEVVV
jgi:hypothetical protein